MKIIYILASLKANGASIAFEHVDRLAERGHDVHLTSLDELETVDFYPLKTIPQKLQDLLEKFKTADAIVGLSAAAAFYINDLDTKARKYYLILNDETQFYTEELFKFKYPKLDKDRLHIEYENQKRYLEASYNLPLHYLVANDGLEYLLKEQYKRKVTVVPIGVNHKLFYPMATFPKTDKVRLITEGNPLPWKGLNDVNRALSNLRGFELWTMSDTGQSIKSNKHWKRPNADEVRNLLSSCDILIRAYHEDGTAELQSQAMACGCAVITTDTSGSKMFCSKDNSVIVKPRDYKSLAKEIKKLIKDKVARESLVRNGLTTVKNLGWEKSIDSLEPALKGKYARSKRRST